MNNEFDLAVTYTKSKCVNGNVPSKRTKSVYSAICDEFPQTITELGAHYSSTDIIWLLSRNLKTFGTCKICSTRLTREQYLHKRRYCGMKCYKKDPEPAQLISDIKSALYSDPAWKSRVEYKKIATNVARSGYEHPMQDPSSFELQQKSSWQSYEYKGICGLRGYEKYAVDRLLEQGVTVDAIVAGSTYLSANKLRLEYKSQVGKIRHYIPDMIVQGTNTFIEVKSEFTLEKGEEDNELFYKAKSVNAAGYNLIVWVFGVDGSLLIDAYFSSSAKVQVALPPAPATLAQTNAVL